MTVFLRYRLRSVSRSLRRAATSVSSPPATMRAPAKATMRVTFSPVKASGVLVNDSPRTLVGIVVVVLSTFGPAVGAGPGRVDVVDVVGGSVVVVVVTSGVVVGGGVVVVEVVDVEVVDVEVVDVEVVDVEVVDVVVVVGGNGTEKQAPPLRFSLPPAWLPPVSLA